MDAFIGEIRLMGFTIAPKGWAFCQGQLLPINQNQALFSLLGTTYGGNGQTNFGLPDLRGRVIVSPGQGPGLSKYAPGQQGGIEAVALQPTEIPNHSHSFTATLAASDSAEGAQPSSSYPGPASSSNPYSKGGTTASMSQAALTGNTATAGVSQGHENRQPLMAMNYAIALQGNFPSRQ
jgi:microcystin-dependent protein